jgi:hypothetical protein
MIASLPVVAGRATIRVSITIRPKAGSFKRETVQCDKTNRLAPAPTLSEIASCLLRLPNPSLLQLTVIASALSAAPTKAKLQSLQAKGISWNYSAVIGKSASPLSGTMGRPILVAQLMQSNLETISKLERKISGIHCRRRYL